MFSSEEFANRESMKGVKKKTICRIKCVDMTKEIIKILGIFDSHDKKTATEKKNKK